MDNTVAYEMFSHQIISLLEVRHKIYNRIVVAVTIRNKVNEELSSTNGDIAYAEQRLHEASDSNEIKGLNRKLHNSKLASKHLQEFYNKLEDLIQASEIDYDWVSSKLAEVMLGLRSYDSDMILHAMWESGSDLDRKMLMLGRETSNANKLSEYSNPFAIEMAAIEKAPANSIQEMISDMVADGEEDRAIGIMRDLNNGGEF